MIKKSAMEHGAFRVVVSNHWSDGGAGALEAAEAVIAACDQKSNFKLLYDLDLSIEEKIQKIGKKMYGCGSVELSLKVRESIKTFNQQVSVVC
jgi:methylenetetrahydrofolate dehydrogenase (NADP+) / methenyltetrahydrofolate cyclohydrolase / formyltetrahydrofolate synthetase